MHAFLAPTTLVLSLTPLIVAQGNATNNNFLGVSTFQRHVVNQTQSQQIITAATAQAVNLSIPVNIAVTDPSGLMVAFQRMDSAFPGSIDISMKKARTVSLFNGAYTTAGLYNLSQPGASLYAIEETNGGLIIFGGGIPIFLDGIFVGAVGVSGGTVDQDISIATAGVQAIGGYVNTTNAS